MTLKEGQRVKLAADTRLTDWAAMTQDSPAAPGGVAGSLLLAAGIEGTVERVVAHEHQSQEAREYERLASLLEAFGRDMPAGSRRQLEEQIASLEPEWTAYQEQRQRVTVRVRFDLGLILDDAHEDAFTPA
ncbi:hypothetical protein K7B10_37200 [Streptomyces flavotricini]|uniref:Uncharacterized protein n=1 Tax=Streptomyces flavotricini TaxID=66888 RepID=A0ABS8EJE8_9ACTN|nr:hypothetical protein [Streptomyces flavotricini]MCC0100319.1 hypothetical protein [Streptomyces flavotricini]